MSAPLSAPEPLADHHQIDAFDCGTPPLDDWLKRRARANQAGGPVRRQLAYGVSWQQARACWMGGQGTDP